MAKRLSAFPSGRAAAGGELKDEWLDGGIYELRQGVDYTSSDDAFRNRVSLEAMRRGIYIRTRKVDGGYVLQAFSPGVPAADGQVGEGTTTTTDGDAGGAENQAPARARGRSQAA